MNKTQSQNKTQVDPEALFRSATAACMDDDLSFALWRLPNESSIRLAASGQPVATPEVNLEETKPGFFFAPFDPGEPKYFLPADELMVWDQKEATSMHGSIFEQILETAPNKIQAASACHIRPTEPYQPSSQAAFEALVFRCRDAVRQGAFEKLVPSRCKEIKLGESFDAVSLFLALTERYPAAMVSMFSSPLTGTWIGATPEMLVHVDANQRFHTAAVAGTQPYSPGTDLATITWTQKEIEEQALVERYIISCFKKIRLREFDEHGPKTVIAGNVVHLKTAFEVDMVATRYPQLGSVMLKLLHPTSAVCGMPMETSLQFLKQHEGYLRQYYCGFLGPVRMGDESQLFVNLRCMQVGHGTALLYAGGGVLSDSDPVQEWQETELKMNTLLGVIRE